MKIPVICHVNKKPDCFDEVISHFSQYQSKQSIQPDKICIIGDRLLTDIVFGNLYGMKTVLVKPLNHFKDHPISIIMR